jgi:hypothetical protein
LSRPCRPPSDHGCRRSAAIGATTHAPFVEAFGDTTERIVTSASNGSHPRWRLTGLVIRPSWRRFSTRIDSPCSRLAEIRCGRRGKRLAHLQPAVSLSSRILPQCSVIFPALHWAPLIRLAQAASPIPAALLSASILASIRSRQRGDTLRGRDGGCPGRCAFCCQRIEAIAPLH